MRVILSLIAGTACVAGAVAAAPADQKQSHSANRPVERDVTLTSGRGRLGFGALQISPELRTQLGAPSDRGILVDAVRADSPVGRAGLRVGDIVVEVDGATTQSASDATRAIADRKKGDRVPIVVVRDKNRVTLQATLQDDPAPAPEAFESDGSRWERLVPGDLPPEMRRMFDTGDLRRSLDDARKRLERLEHRVDELEHGRPAH
jgi:membrane-associated protease RseP (regulator of RpoE activity)